jgi:hypothetical protein
MSHLSCEQRIYVRAGVTVQNRPADVNRRKQDGATLRDSLTRIICSHQLRSPSRRSACRDSGVVANLD